MLTPQSLHLIVNTQLLRLLLNGRDENGNLEVRTENSDLGGTMRLEGAQPCHLSGDSLVRTLYGKIPPLQSVIVIVMK